MATFKQYTKKNGDKLWQYQAYLGIDEKTGKRKATTHRGFKSKKEAQIHLNLFLADYERQTLDQTPPMTFQELYNLFLVSYRLQVKESTLALRIRFAENHILPVLKDIYIDKISVSDCQKLVNKWHDKFASYKQLRSLSGHILQFGVQMELIDTNPMKKTILPRKKEIEKLDNFYTKSQLNNFFSCIDDYLSKPNQTGLKLLIYFRLLAFTGMRKSEVLALQWQDINLQTGELNISKTLATGLEGKIIIQSPKTRKSKRIISLDPITLEQLKKYRVEQYNIYQFYNINTMKQEQYLFTTRENKFIHPSATSQWLYIILNRYNLPKITLHGFRHTHATLLLESGASIKEVQERLGHDSAMTTLNIYAHLIPERQNESGEKFAKYVNF